MSNSNKAYSQEDFDFVKRFKEDFNNDELARKLGRTKQGIVYLVKKTGCRKFTSSKPKTGGLR